HVFTFKGLAEAPKAEPTAAKEDFKVVYKLPNGSEQTQEYKSVSYDDFIVNALASADASKASYGDYTYDVDASSNTYVFTFKGLAEAPKAEPTAAKEDFKVVYKLPNGSEQTHEYKSVSYDDFIVNALASADASKASYGDYTYDVDATSNTYVFTFAGLKEAPKADEAAKEEFKVIYNDASGKQFGEIVYTDVTYQEFIEGALQAAELNKDKYGDFKYDVYPNNVYVFTFEGLKEEPKVEEATGDYTLVLNFADFTQVVYKYNDVTASYMDAIAKDLADSYVAEKGEHSEVFIDGNTYYYNFAGLKEDADKAKDDKAADKAKDDKAADKAKDDKAADKAKDDKAADKAKDDKAADKAKDDKAADKAKDDKAADKAKDDKAADKAKDDKAADKAKDDKAADKAKDDKAADKAKDDKAADKAKDDKAADKAKDDKAADKAKDDKAADKAKDDKAADKAKDDKAADKAKDDKAELPSTGEMAGLTLSVLGAAGLALAGFLRRKGKNKA
ncbi:LPXTG cell wall anchor domain-containing protein, partial [Streptococcus suis]|nr:LPXTG cell wall anchor domain-containing protein [Streptococcus suis]